LALYDLVPKKNERTKYIHIKKIYEKDLLKIVLFLKQKMLTWHDLGWGAGKFFPHDPA
jgi:hypothetical protein